MAMVEDLDVFFNLDEHGDTVTIQKTGASFVGLFDKEFLEIVGVESSDPVLLCQLSDAQTLKYGDRLTILGASYIVRTDKPDGKGIIEIKLEAE